jgi:hypothetical protein
VINSAADVLTSAELREQYDRQGLAALPASRYKILHDYIKRGSSAQQQPPAAISRIMHSSSSMEQQSASPSLFCQVFCCMAEKQGTVSHCRL